MRMRKRIFGHGEWEHQRKEGKGGGRRHFRKIEEEANVGYI